MIELSGDSPEIEYRWSEAEPIASDAVKDIPEEFGVYGMVRMSKRAGSYLKVRFGVEVGKLMQPLTFVEDPEEHVEVDIDDAVSVFGVLHKYLIEAGPSRDKYSFRLYRGLFESIGSAARHNMHIIRLQDFREKTGRLLLDLMEKYEQGQDQNDTDC